MAAYVDNYAVLGADPATVNTVAHEIGQELRRTGFTVHEEKQASSQHQFAGLSLTALPDGSALNHQGWRESNVH